MCCVTSKKGNDFKYAFLGTPFVVSHICCNWRGRFEDLTKVSDDGRPFVIRTAPFLAFPSPVCRNDGHIKERDRGERTRAAQKSVIATLPSGSRLLQLNGVT